MDPSLSFLLGVILSAAVCLAFHAVVVSELRQGVGTARAFIAHYQDDFDKFLEEQESHLVAAGRTEEAKLHAAWEKALARLKL